MKTITTKLISVLLSMAVVVGVLAAMPITVSAADQTVTITQSDTVAQIQAKIENAIVTAGGSGTVTVNGSKSNADACLSLHTVYAGVTTLWRADYSGSVSGNDMINLGGAGTFEVASGSINNNGMGNTIRSDSGTVTIKVSGGTVSANDAAAICSYNGNFVIVNGGTVSSVNEWAIYTNGSTLTINGGMVSSLNSDAIDSYGSTVNINGGIVSSTGPYCAIFASDSSNSKINISGGFVFAYGTAITKTAGGSAIWLRDSTPAPTIGGNAVICVWNQAADITTYTEGTTTNLVINTGASVTWAKSGSQDGISYSNATNSGFFPISGIVVNAYVAPTYTVTVNGGTGSGDYEEGDTVSISAGTAAEGKVFDKWTASGVSLANAGNADTSFIMPANPVTLTATYMDLPIDSYQINVSSSEGGTANANVSYAQAGDTVTLTAQANAGYKFKEWQVISGGITVTDNKFTMPNGSVTIKALFELIPSSNPPTSSSGDDTTPNNMLWLWGGLGALVVLALGGGGAFILSKNRKKEV